MSREVMISCLAVVLAVTILPADDAPKNDDPSYTVGSLLNERGEAVEGASVYLFPVKYRVAPTDREGRFRLVPPSDLLTADCLVLLANRRTVRGRVKSSDPLVVEAQIDGVMLQGIWNVAALRNNGRPEQPIEQYQVFIDGRRLAFRQHGRLLHERQYSYSLDASRPLPFINLSRQGVSIPGIYTWDEEQLVLCFNENNDQRPTAFESEENTPNDLLLVLEPAPETHSLDDVVGIDDPVNNHFREVLSYTGEVTFPSNPLDDAVRHLSTLYDTTIEVAPHVDRNLEVALAVQDTSLHTTLLMMLTPHDLRYVLRDGQILVTSTTQQ